MDACPQKPGRDVEHSLIDAGEPFKETWSLIGEEIRHIHVKDFSLTAYGKRKPELPGKGLLPARELFSLLKENSCQGLLSLEWERFWHPELPELRKALDAREELVQ